MKQLFEGQHIYSGCPYERKGTPPRCVHPHAPLVNGVHNCMTCGLLIVSNLDNYEYHYIKYDKDVITGMKIENKGVIAVIGRAPSGQLKETGLLAQTEDGQIYKFELQE